jgi:hypothetical protein
MGYWHNKCSQIWTSLVKIQIDGAFHFGDDLSFVNNIKHIQTMPRMMKDVKQQKDENYD